MIIVYAFHVLLGFGYWYLFRKFLSIGCSFAFFGAGVVLIVMGLTSEYNDFLADMWNSMGRDALIFQLVGVGLGVVVREKLYERWESCEPKKKPRKSPKKPEAALRGGEEQIK